MCAEADGGGPGKGSREAPDGLPDETLYRAAGWPYGDADRAAALKALRGRMTWKEWLLYDFLRYWYGVGALALVAFSVTYLAWRYHADDLAGLSAIAAGGLALAAIELMLYKAIWPKGAFTQGWPAGRRLRKAILRLRWRL